MHSNPVKTILAKHRRRSFSAVAAVAATATLSLGLAACGNSTVSNSVPTTAAGVGSSGNSNNTSPTTSAGQPVTGGTLTAAIPSDPTSLDWASNTDALTIDIAQNVFELLYAPDQGWAPKPMLASGYTLSSNRLVYTFSLRQGVKFQNGQTMTSADVVASMERWFKVSGTGELVAKTVKSVTADGPYKMVVKLTKPQYSFIADLCSYVGAMIVIPASIAKAAGTNPLKDNQIIGTGPYELKKYVHGNYIELTRYAGYKPTTGNYGGLAGHKTAYITNLIFKIVPADTVRLDGIQTGEWQFAATLNNDDYNQIEQRTSSTVAEPEGGALIEYMLINSGTGLFKNLKAREALNMIMNKKQLAEATLGPSALWTPLSGQIALPNNKPMYSTAGMNVYNDYNPTEAKKLFAEAGITSSTPITILSTQTYPQFYALAQTVQAELKKIGITANIKTYDFPTMISKLTEQPNSWNLSMTGFAGEPLDLNQVLFLEPSWAGGFKSTAMNQAFAQYEAATSATQAKAAVDKVQSLVWSELPDIGVGTQALLDASSTKLHGYEDFIGQGFWNAWLSK